ncbi:hypothetical protein GCM10025787_36820 [Saccharopolyspora rosea]|uniref:Secreted protein n=1 Tax=Saccharopolyspora rosea TaxID=524884 RepID=A0ABW3FMU0_9PSEU
MRIAVLAAGLSALALAGTGIGIAAAEPATAVRDCAGASRTEPGEIVLTCADGNSAVRDLHWVHWGSERAEGTGTAEIATCEPDCATGGVRARPVRITLDTPRDGVFTRAVLDGRDSYELPANR